MTDFVALSVKEGSRIFKGFRTWRIRSCLEVGGYVVARKWQAVLARVRRLRSNGFTTCACMRVPSSDRAEALVMGSRVDEWAMFIPRL